MSKKALTPGIAALLELLPGLILHTFGIGWIFSGRVVFGLFLMFSFWIVTAINFVLLHVLIGFITWPLCFIPMLILSPIMVARRVRAQAA